MTLWYSDDHLQLHLGKAHEVLAELPDESVDMVLTSPPYYQLRDYKVEGQLGHEVTPQLYVRALMDVLNQVKRVLTPTGTCWLNVADSYAGKANGGATFDRHRGHGHRAGIIPAQRNNLEHAPYKSLLAVPARVQLALIDSGWTVRNDIIWNKPNAMPERVEDRVSTRYEHLFLITKGPSYHFDLDAIRVDRADSTIERYRYPFKVDANPASDTNHLSTGGMMEKINLAGRNPGDVWSINTEGFAGPHYATMPTQLADNCVRAGCAPGGIVLDPFSGVGTTGWAALRHGHDYIGIDLDPAALTLSLKTRLQQSQLH